MLRDSATANQILQQLAENQFTLSLHDIVCLRQLRKNSLRVKRYLRSANNDCCLRTQFAQHSYKVKNEWFIPYMHRKAVDLCRYSHDFFQHR